MTYVRVVNKREFVQVVNLVGDNFDVFSDATSERGEAVGDRGTVAFIGLSFLYSFVRRVRWYARYV